MQADMLMITEAVRKACITMIIFSRPEAIHIVPGILSGELHRRSMTFEFCRLLILSRSIISGLSMEYPRPATDSRAVMKSNSIRIAKPMMSLSPVWGATISNANAGSNFITFCKTI